MRFGRKRRQEAEEPPESQDTGDAPRLQDTTERAAMPLPLPGSDPVAGNQWVPPPPAAPEPDPAADPAETPEAGPAPEAALAPETTVVEPESEAPVADATGADPAPAPVVTEPEPAPVPASPVSEPGPPLEPEPVPPAPDVEPESPLPDAVVAEDAAESAVAATPAAAEPPPEAQTTTFQSPAAPGPGSGFSLRTDDRAAGAESASRAIVPAPVAKRPELMVGAAFVGGLALALIVRRRRG